MAINPKKHEMPTQEPLARARNFDEVALGYSEEIAIAEASRCITCKNQPCVSGCPVNIDIPNFISKIKDGKFEDAYNVISLSSSLPAVCGRVCPQETQCESKCTLGIKFEPVGIGRLERFVTDWHNENSKELPQKPKSNGKKVAEIARCFGMNVVAWTRTPRDPECVTLDELLAKSDVISLHCPLFPETRNLINRDTIARMKDGAIIINTSRGPVINDADVAEALKSGKLYAAAADVATVEPIPADNPLLGLKNMFFTPHIAWATYEARVRLMNIAVENVKAFQAGAPVNMVS